MASAFSIEELTIRKLFTEREINYEVFHQGDYLFRLVPSLTGFKISPLDEAMDQPIDEALVQKISNHIENMED